MLEPGVGYCHFSSYNPTLLPPPISIILRHFNEILISRL